MPKHLIDIEDIPPQLTNRVKQNLQFKTGNFVWRIKFNTPLDPKSVNSDTMYVTNSSNQRLRSYIKYDIQTEEIEIEPLEPYAASEYYNLVITTNVRSRGGQTMKEPISIKFKL